VSIVHRSALALGLVLALAAPAATRAEEPATPATPVTPSAPDAPAATDTPKAADAPELPGVVVTAPRVPADEGVSTPLATQETAPDERSRGRLRDGAALLDDTPGAAVSRNGALTGIAQVRGLSNERVRVLVDDMTITPACANHMDPPLHYAPVTSLESLRIVAGVTPVSQGGDSIAGTIVATPRGLRFADDDAFAIDAEAGSHYSTAYDGFGFRGFASAATRNVGASYAGSWQKGNDLYFPGGHVRDTGFETQQHDMEIATRGEWGRLSLDAGLGRTPEAGTPALPMDIVDDDSEHMGARFTTRLGAVDVEARGYWHHIDHVMDNFSLRPNAASAAQPRMESPAHSEDVGGILGFSLPLAEGHLARLGGDLVSSRFDSTIRNLTLGQTQTGIPHSRRSRLGTYLEWEARWSEAWQTLLGVRNDMVWTEADEVSQTFRPANRMMARMLAADRAAFDAADRDRTDANFDATALVRFAPSAGQRYELGLARKTRSPSLLERYQWTPLAANAGYADGRLYFGDVDLRPEVAYQLGLTGRWEGERWEISLAPYYTHVHDYIQGDAVPGRVDPMTGLPVLRYRNFERVVLYGVDAQARVQLHEHVALRGWLAYVRGRNRSSGDDLYRIMPLHGAIDLDLTWGPLRGTIETVLAARQTQVARYNGEPETPGYGVLNLSAGYLFRERVDLAAGVDNIFNKRWSPHTNGLNRVGGGDLAVGARLPSSGRALWTSVTLRY
jgi:iron complex outermembrane receptor protein